MSSWLSNISDKVTSAAGKVSTALQDDTILEKLTLTTPELKAERQALDASERRKEHVRNMLAGMLPWETRDPERDILVEECRDAILQLSADKSNFFGPYPMPKMDAKTDDSDDEDDDSKGEAEKEREAVAKHDPYDPIKPTPESKEKLEKLEPLPPLLENFDFNAHVGLIEKILAEDKQLVKMQSSLSGGGIRERTFWRNYFFHCAFTRYEAGLSIDEIWGDMTEEERAAAARQSTPQKASTGAVDHQPEDEHEETITFHHDHEESDSKSSKEQQQQQQQSSISSGKPSPEADSSSNKSYEMVDGEVPGDAGDADDVNLDGAVDDEAIAEGDAGEDDYELDELEAEIARELED